MGAGAKPKEYAIWHGVDPLLRAINYSATEPNNNIQEFCLVMLNKDCHSLFHHIYLIDFTNVSFVCFFLA